MEKVNSNNMLFIRRKSYRWLSLSDAEIKDIRNKFKILSPKAKEYFNFIPFLSIVLTQSCTLRCEYCSEGGEGTYSQQPYHNLEVLKKRIEEAFELGVRKIRLTGGEPFLYPKIKELLVYLKKLKDSYDFFLLINTNATLSILKNYISLLKELEAKVVVHIDTIHKDTYIKINKSNESIFNTVLKNIKLLKDEGLLHRFNTVISKYNINEFWDLVDYAREMETNMKIFDITEVPEQYRNKDEIYVPLDGLIEELEKRARDKFFHPYTLAFGTPVIIYDVDGVLISVKYTKYGSRYDPIGYCKNCPFFPCDEGLYDILYYPDDKLWACRWHRPKEILRDNFKQDLQTLFKVYKRARWFIGNKFVE